MKRLFPIALLLLGVLTACQEKTPPPTDEPGKEVKLDPMAKLMVNPSSTKAGELHTAEYIVTNCAFVNRYHIRAGIQARGSLGLDEEGYSLFHDIVNFKFTFLGIQVVDEEGKPGDFFEWEDMAFTVALLDGKRIHPLEVVAHLQKVTEDTIAYIPNAVARKCKADIRAALDAGNLEECYRIFKEDYVFVPIENGAAWRKLKAAGIE